MIPAEEPGFAMTHLTRTIRNPHLQSPMSRQINACVGYLPGKNLGELLEDLWRRAELIVSARNDKSTANGRAILQSLRPPMPCDHHDPAIQAYHGLPPPNDDLLDGSELKTKLTSTQCIMWNSSSTQSSPCQPFPASIFSEQRLKCLAGSAHSFSSHSARIAGAGCCEKSR